MTWDQYHSQYSGNARLYDDAESALTMPKGSAGSMHVIDNNEANPKYLATPENGGVPNAIKLVDGVGTASLIPYYIAATIATNGGGDDVLAADHLKNGYSDVRFAFPGETIEFDVSNDTLDDGTPVYISRIYWIAVGNTAAGPGTAAPANYTGNVAIIADSDTADANWQANLIKDTFAQVDNVRKVRIKVGPIVATNFVHVAREGVSYA